MIPVDSASLRQLIDSRISEARGTRASARYRRLCLDEAQVYATVLAGVLAVERLDVLNAAVVHHLASPPGAPRRRRRGVVRSVAS